jgi:hypothetical protein
MSPQMKTYYSINELPKLSRNTSAVVGSKPEGRYGVQVIKNLPVLDCEDAWAMTCVVTGRKFSPIQVPVHFLKASVCNGQAYKKLMESKRSKKRRK